MHPTRLQARAASTLQIRVPGLPSTDTIIAAIRTVAAGGRVFGSLEAVVEDWFTLTDRERDVVVGVVLGRTNDEIGGRLGISRKGVEAHLSRLYERAEVSSRTDLAVRAERERWLDDA